MYCCEEKHSKRNTAKQEYRCFQKYCQPLGELPLLSNYKEAKILIHRVIKCIDNFFHLDTNPSDVLCIPFIFLISQYVNIIVYFSNTIKYYCSKVLKGIVRQLLLFYCYELYIKKNHRTLYIILPVLICLDSKKKIIPRFYTIIQNPKSVALRINATLSSEIPL